MTRDPCPRCGAQRPSLGACPECGYEDPHPGVLGSFSDAVDELRDRPRLFLPFLIPTVVLVATQALLSLVEGSGTQTVRVSEVAAGLTALFLQAGWYFVILGAIVPAVTGQRGSPEVPGGPVYVGAAQGALLVVAPWALLAAILLNQPSGALGALALLASIVLLISTVVAAGRAIGIPVEAALTGASGLDLFKRGNRRARENGGLGLAFLALMSLVVAFAGPALCIAAGLGRPSPITMLVLGSVSSWFVGTWAGLAFAIGLSGGDVGVEATFDCPACGQEARVEGGRARCECGLEGPYYSGPGVGP